MGFSLSTKCRSGLRKALKVEGHSQKKAAEVTGLNPEDVSRLLSGSAGVGAERGKILCDYYSVPLEIRLEDEETTNYTEVPLYDRPIVMNNGKTDLVETVELPEAWMPKSADSSVGLVKMVGDSMAPTFNVGDIIGVQFGSGFIANGMYACRVHDTVMIAKLQRKFNSFRIIFDNPQYEDLDCNDSMRAEDFEIIGKVNYAAKFF